MRMGQSDQEFSACQRDASKAFRGGHGTGGGTNVWNLEFAVVSCLLPGIQDDIHIRTQTATIFPVIVVGFNSRCALQLLIVYNAARTCGIKILLRDNKVRYAYVVPGR